VHARSGDAQHALGVHRAARPNGGTRRCPADMGVSDRCRRPWVDRAVPRKRCWPRVRAGAGPRSTMWSAARMTSEVVLHHHDGVAQAAQFLQDADQAVSRCGGRWRVRPARSRRPPGASRDRLPVGCAAPRAGKRRGQAVERKYSRPTSFRNLSRWRISTRILSAMGALLRGQLQTPKNAALQRCSLRATSARFCRDPYVERLFAQPAALAFRAERISRDRPGRRARQLVFFVSRCRRSGG